MADPKTSKNAAARPSEGSSAGAFDRDRIPFYRGPSGDGEASAMTERLNSAAAMPRRGAVQKAPGRLLDGPGTHAASASDLAQRVAFRSRAKRGLIERSTLEVLEERIRESIPYVDDYDVDLGGPNGLTYVKRRPLVVRGQLVSILDVFPAGALAALEEGTSNRREERVTFLSRFADVLRARPEAPPAGGAAAISLQQLLGGAANVRLYTRAIIEENNSAAFRAAVVLASVEAFRDEIELLDWTLPKHLIIGGPSGAGKTFATKSILRALMRYAHLAPELTRSVYVTEQVGSRSSGAHGKPTPVPFIVGVDGGDARATSQIRKLVLQAALVLGYVGISDLHAKTASLDIKHQIKEAAFHTASRVHVVEPRTFANVLNESYASVARERVRERGIFCLVNTPDDVIRFQGEARAWYDFGNKGLKVADEVSLNKADIGCESKEYSDANLDIGRNFSRNAHVKYMDDAVARGRVPVSVLFDNRARLVGGVVAYELPNIEIHYGPFRSQRGVIRKKGEFAELPPAVRALLHAAQSARRPTVRAGTEPALARDPTAVVHVPDQQVIVAHGFEPHVAVEPSSPEHVARRGSTSEEFLVMEPVLTTVALPPGEATVQTRNHEAWERAKRAGQVDANLVHVPIEATGYCFLTAVATHLGKSTRALIDDLDAAARRLGTEPLLRWCRELRSAGGLRRGAEGIDPAAIEDVLVEAGLAVEIVDFESHAPQVVVVSIPAGRNASSDAVRLLFRSRHFDLLLPEDAVASLDLSDDGSVYVAKGFRDATDLDRDPFSMAPRDRSKR